MGFIYISAFIGQLGMYYHFLSDIIAGTALGVSVAYYNTKYSNRFI